MVAKNGTSYNLANGVNNTRESYFDVSNANGVYARELYPPCTSDYEPAQVIDITPQPAPKPAWRDQLAPVTWSMSYTDSSGISHSCTLRGDTEEEVLATVKPIVAGVRKAKQLAKEHAPQQAEPEPDSDVPRCKLHVVPMQRAVSKRTGGTYWFHDLGPSDRCFGRERSKS